MQASSWVSWMLAGAAVVVLLPVQPAWSLQKVGRPQQALPVAPQEQQQEPEMGPEPYSFSYNSPSLGAMATHQETGDGRGRVQGFYMIQAEDGRERRVDYVADENGFRASVSTNEIGTRSESSADAQYRARLPSAGQLEQAKVSADEYQFLEEAHQAERERHLNQLSENTQQQQQQQDQQQQTRFATNQRDQQQQLGATPSGWSGQFGANQTEQPLPQPVERFQDRRNQTGELEANEGWRQRSFSIGQKQQSQQQQQQQVSNSQNQFRQSGSRVAPVVSGPKVFEPSSQPINGQQEFASTSGPLDTSAGGQPNSNVAQMAAGLKPEFVLRNPAPVAQRQQAQVAAWQMSTRGALPARKLTTVMQRQLEQQFMQQAFHLTDQDYPRQEVSTSAKQNQQRAWSSSSSSSSPPQQQQQQKVGQSASSTLKMATNLPEQVNERGGQMNELSQINQLQSNANDDETSGEQMEPLQPLVSLDQLPAQQGESGDSNRQPDKQGENFPTMPVGSEQQFVPETTTTNASATYSTSTAANVNNATSLVGSTTSAGFLSINLQSDENSAQANQEVDNNNNNNNNSERPSSSLVPEVIQPANQAPQVTSAGQEPQLGDNREQSFAFEQTKEQLQPASQQDFKPSSMIKQMMEPERINERPQETGRATTSSTTPASTTGAFQAETTSANVTREPELSSAPEQATTNEPIGKTVGQPTSTARPKAGLVQGQASSSSADETGGSNRTGSDQFEPAQFATVPPTTTSSTTTSTTTRRPASFNRQQQGFVVSGGGGGGGGQNSFFSRQRSQYSPNGTKSASRSETGAAVVAFQPTRMAPSSSSSQSSSSSFRSSSTQAPVEQDERSREQVDEKKTADQFVRQEPPRSPSAMGSQRQNGAPKMIEPSTSVRPSFIASDNRGQSQSPPPPPQVEQSRSSGLKGTSSKVTNGRKQQFWQSQAPRQQPLRQQVRSLVGQASVHYASNNAALSASQSPSFGSRISGRRR